MYFGGGWMDRTAVWCETFKQQTILYVLKIFLVFEHYENNIYASIFLQIKTSLGLLRNTIFYR